MRKERERRGISRWKRTKSEKKVWIKGASSRILKFERPRDKKKGDDNAAEGSPLISFPPHASVFAKILMRRNL